MSESLEQDARDQAVLNNATSAMVMSASWQCPVCDTPGHIHQANCFVKKLADEAHRLRVANKKLTRTLARFREDAERPGRTERWLTKAGVVAERMHLAPVRWLFFALADVRWRRSGGQHP